MRITPKLAKIWAENLIKARLMKKKLVEPMGITWHATDHCNFKCQFCDDGKGNKYPDIKSYTMDTEEVKEVLSLARKKVSLLYITGGEPLLRNDLTEILKWAKEEARFHYIGLVTNGVLLPKNEKLLKYVDDLTISLHSLNEEFCDDLISCGKGMCHKIISAVKRYAELKHVFDYEFNVSCVAIPGHIQDARNVMNFCFEHNVAYTVMPQSIGPYPHPELINNSEYVSFVDEVSNNKRNKKPVWGSYAYYRTIRDFKKFKCYPTAVPRIFPNGDLIYPCSPLNKVAGNLIGAESFDSVLAQGIDLHGPVPNCDTRCFASCYIETSFVIQFPLSLLMEHFKLNPQKDL